MAVFEVSIALGLGLESDRDPPHGPFFVALDLRCRAASSVGQDTRCLIIKVLAWSPFLNLAVC